MGETSIDEQTFVEYLDQIKEHYTADKVSVYFDARYLSCSPNSVPSVR
jgi:hypothetical protein